MLQTLARLFGIQKQEAKILVLGLDNSGKSTLINRFKARNLQKSIITPTIGFGVEKCETKGLSLICFDMSGQGRYRNLWEHYYDDCTAVIFVIDSSDNIRLVVAQDELNELLINPKIVQRRIPILFFANKMDVHGALNAGEIANVLTLDKIRDKPWNICASNALTGEGVETGLLWLTNQVKTLLNSK
ncbi:ADP-ribosylation factor-like protein 6 [Cichlidogyrus casuarinus]|uniref:ADP-ribosylation factor-like protein 6 n=1 Tax=Cichlidogyrus casuarinus TaxID=1844966 RepID=A0ABD2Q2Z0_9PLAT